MGLAQVVRGIGKGSVFCHGRIFAIHNPLDEDINKARDPFINLRTLARLSKSDDAALRHAVAQNLSGRIGDGSAHRRIFALFVPPVIADAIAMSSNCMSSEDLSRMVYHAEPAMLNRLASSSSPAVLMEILKSPQADPALCSMICARLPRELLLRAALLPKPSFSRIYSNPAIAEPGLVAYCMLEKKSDIGMPPYRSGRQGISQEEFGILSTSLSRAVLERVAAHPDAPAAAIAMAISALVPKTRKVVDKPSVKVGARRQTAMEIAEEGKDPAYCIAETIDIYSEEASHLEYGQHDIRTAASLLCSCPASKRQEIFLELNSINPALASSLMQSAPGSLQDSRSL